MNKQRKQAERERAAKRAERRARRLARKQAKRNTLRYQWGTVEPDEQQWFGATPTPSS